MGKSKLALYLKFIFHLFSKLKSWVSEEYYLFKMYINKGTFLFGNNHIQNSTISKYSYVAFNTIIRNCKIGRYCSIGPNVVIGFGDHKTTSLSTHPSIFLNIEQFKTDLNQRDNDTFREVTIRNDVWIGANVYIRNGITIGNGAVVAAGSIVIHDVPDFAIVGGVPAILIKYRFNEETIMKINDSKWWEKDIEQLDIDLLTFEKTGELKRIIPL